MIDDHSNTNKYIGNELKDLIDNIPYTVWIKGSDGIYKYVNKAYADVTGVKPEDIIGKNDYEIRDKETSELFLAEDREILSDERTVLNRKTPVNMEYKVFFEVSRMIINSNNPNLKLIGGIGRDITINETLYKEIEKSTLTLLDNKNIDNKSELPYILKNTLKANGITVLILDEEKKKMNIFLKTYDNDVISKNFSLDITQEYKDKCIEAQKDKKYLEGEYIINSKKYYLRTYVIEFEDELIGVLNIHYDCKETFPIIQEDVIINTCNRLGVIIKNRILTNKYKVEIHKRKESEKKLQLFLDNAIDFCVISNTKQFYFENESSKKRLEKFLGYSIEEINSKNGIESLRHPDDKQKIKRMYEAAKVCNKIEGIVIRYLCKDNEYRSVMWNIRYIMEDDKFFLTGKDITYRLKLEKEKNELEKTIEIESLKTDFFANMSHEFKTPLNIILTTVQVLYDKLIVQDNNIDNLQMIKKYLKGIKQNSYRLLKIVNNIMDITKIDSGIYNLELGNYNIISIVEDIVISLSGYLKQNKRNIIFDTMEEEVILACDPMKIERIMLNLLSNALKYTNENGNIDVIIDIDKEKNEVIVNVKNDGDRISEDDKERIFERFTQSQNLFTRKAEGTGIGLFLVKLLVEQHGGRIYVDTSEEIGTKFVFTLPITLVEEKKENYTYTKQIVSKVEKYDIEFSDIYSI
ncbi:MULTISPECIES: PAS domain-containing sensor histidine kinase [Clostridium]|uniref:PAS domain-containing sensor histidine kinase n=1 Tax=Clostridium TaxID=1485 RepID=UPI0012B6B991|nr:MULTISPECIES: PAS domain-containing sensor histidine kinase [Clostridium]MBS4841544.1 PAS domain S-box protein [Clostridium sp.]MDB2161859.1 PAS domain-containing sensor histidine kinase [Clostridium butyricum]MDU1403406.1 PAS domain-containing sensor histidine kinase [Clostridium sp.]MDU2896609.1 PAS domain-containing sensor histidine kinase [Clostridium sp.]MDU3007165.1 PAS domain-containing sensor histidine kinase [Clostridium sp.]